MQLDGFAPEKKKRDAVNWPTERQHLHAARFVCDGILDKCANGKFHVCGCSQSLRVRQFFGNVEGSGSTINLGDRQGEKCEMNEQH